MSVDDKHTDTTLQSMEDRYRQRLGRRGVIKSSSMSLNSDMSPLPLITFGPRLAWDFKLRREILVPHPFWVGVAK